MVKLGNKLQIKKVKIGILGGSFDPAHKGHLAISKDALKRFNFRSIIWAITNQNPFKGKTADNLKKRITICKKVIGTNKSGAKETVDTFVADVDSFSNKSLVSFNLESHLKEKKCTYYTYDDWKKQNDFELSEGEKKNKKRFKLTTITDIEHCLKIKS